MSTPTAQELLLAERNDAGHWVGCLSSSALSTATSSFTLALYLKHHPTLPSAERAKFSALIEGGARWLTETQNPDGGWGDTTRSPSNISTTTLCWAALSFFQPEARPVITAAEAWLKNAAGALTPEHLAATIAARYGKDRTFSVPILTMCALAGRLGEGEAAWRVIPRLPFELAALPHTWFQWLQLPVVSYALPALIAIGQVGHHFHPTGNPVLRALRERARPKTLALLQTIQPEGGGFLEAAPLTSFVTMSLVACGQLDSPVVVAGLDFLVRSARPDGSWPIDTNLATWVTTLAINALSASGPLPLAAAEQDTLRTWLLNQQYRVEHPYTHAAPGGWAWTDLPGGVPDADDTAGALIALHRLGPEALDVAAAAQLGVTWLLALQNRDGGMPTFCRGWGALPFDRSGADLTAHALLAWSTWREHLPVPLPQRIDQATQKALTYLARQQRPDGSWVPLWFGNHAAPHDENPTYGTARVLLALYSLPESSTPTQDCRERGLSWLLKAQSPTGGWGGDHGVGPSLEETGLALQALAQARRATGESDTLDTALAQGQEWVRRHLQEGHHHTPAPIGFYFANLWYFERLYPLLFSAGAAAGTEL